MGLQRKEDRLFVGFLFVLVSFRCLVPWSPIGCSIVWKSMETTRSGRSEVTLPSPGRLVSVTMRSQQQRRVVMSRRDPSKAS